MERARAVGPVHRLRATQRVRVPDARVAAVRQGAAGAAAGAGPLLDRVPDVHRRSVAVGRDPRGGTHGDRGGGGNVRGGGVGDQRRGRRRGGGGGRGGAGGRDDGAGGRSEDIKI